MAHVGVESDYAGQNGQPVTHTACCTSPRLRPSRECTSSDVHPLLLGGFFFRGRAPPGGQDRRRSRSKNVGALDLRTEPGTISGVARRFCGAGHTDMRFSRVAHSAPGNTRRHWPKRSQSVGGTMNRETRAPQHRSGCIRQLSAIWNSGGRAPEAQRAVNHTRHRQALHEHRSSCFFAIGGLLAMLIRAQLATPHSRALSTRRPTTRSSRCTAP